MEPADKPLTGQSKDGHAMPNQTVADLLRFVNAGASTATQISPAIAEIGRKQVRVVAIKLLSWMKSQHRIGKLWPLELLEKFEWCRNLLHLMQKQAFASDLIHATDTTVVFLPELNEDQVKTLLAFVDAGYQPQLMRKAPRRIA